MRPSAGKVATRGRPQRWWSDREFRVQNPNRDALHVLQPTMEAPAG